MCTCYSRPAIKQINYIYISTGLIGLALDLAVAVAAAAAVSKMSNSGFSLKTRSEGHLPKSRQRFKLCMRWKTHTLTLTPKKLTNANANFLASRWKEERAAGEGWLGGKSRDVGQVQIAADPFWNLVLQSFHFGMLSFCCWPENWARSEVNLFCHFAFVCSCAWAWACFKEDDSILRRTRSH